MLGKILRNDFGLKYKRYNGAVVQYKNPDLDDKRRWACRILAEFLADDSLIISLDESNFRHDNNKSFKW